MPPTPLHPVRSLAALALLAALGAHAPAQAEEAAALDIGLEDLLKADVQTASRKAQQLREVPAAAYVITREDIERSGATSIPEALRLAPGVQVARLANNRWAVSARGFNGRFANKLQVLIDGRSVYAPIFGGVMWELEDTLLEDVARIEVLRGPAASMWGANAVNGVINIITRHARDTLGTQATLGAGSEERAFGSLRHGFRAGDDGHARLWARGFYRSASVTLDGQDGNDFWHLAQVGGRGDWTFGQSRRLMVSGAWFQNQRGERMDLADLTSPTGARLVSTGDPSWGGHLVVRHDWMLGDGAEAALQGFIHRSDFELAGEVRESRTTYDLDFQHRLAPQGRHDVMWGAGLRWSLNSLPPGGFATVMPATASYRLLNLFVQDDITLVPETWRATLGARLEQSNFTSVLPQPTARLLWTPDAQQSFWLAASRAMRLPSRAEQNAVIDLAAMPAMPPSQPLPVLLRAQSIGLGPEQLLALDAGWRREFSETLSLDVAAYRNRYTRLRGSALGATEMALQDMPPHVVQLVETRNVGAATISGLEAALDWRPTRTLRIQPQYTYMHVALDPLPPGADPLGGVSEVKGNAPAHQMLLRAAWNASDAWRFDAVLRHVSALPGRDAYLGVPAYTELNLRLAWRLARDTELALVGQNLLHARHLEFIPDWMPSAPVMVQRSVYVKVKTQF